MHLAKFKLGSCKKGFISSMNFEDKINILGKKIFFEDKKFWG